ncbi:hypothetical protein BN946_scf184836.g7 [Trametes cinnabarina]|uniref:F-box domain-containing protein n=1 Tax=Pycnoporus cinnabarinus TaxID=5643 RepID=A0A060SC17_PYCCI|nr:hypothetical protein BN946_scf184836.g7 [Trametes cinnabarina]
MPSESLTHITSFLDPPDLLALARTCKQLHAHVADDNTWRRAYVYQYLGITPESDLRDDAGDKTLMLRRKETSWRKEFVMRYNLRRRWEYSRNAAVTHIPHHSSIAAMHLMPNTTLLAASMQYGVVSRSFPLTGKVLRGFLDASGTANGLGIGNPNAEFSPHVSSVALASEGGTGKILWGYRNGEVAVTTAVRIMDNTRASAARLIRCRLGDCHEGAVECVAWDRSVDGSSLFVTGGADGRVKLWDAKTTLQCLWTSNKDTSPMPDPPVKLTTHLQQGIVSAALKSGNVVVWTDFPSLPWGSADLTAPEPRELRISAPTAPVASGSSSFEGLPFNILDLRISPSGDHLPLLVAYRHSAQFHRLTWVPGSSGFERTPFGDPAAVPINAVLPIWATRQGEKSFVITGDELGTISIFSWDERPKQSTPSGVAFVPPVHQFAAHEDGAITSLAWNSTVLVTGSSRGTINIWDALTFAPLRSMGSPAAKPSTGGEWDHVSHILLERDTLLVAVGSRVMAWKAGPVGRPGMHGKGKTLRSAKTSGTAKWHQQMEMQRDIAESRRELEEEEARTRRTFGREREQLSTLANLGLDEVEAVEYVLMLSRDEEEARWRNTTLGEDEGVFMADFDDVPTPMVTPDSMFGSETPSAISSRTSSRSSSDASMSVFHGGRSYTRSVASSSNHKIQVSPRFRPEPLEAGPSVSPVPARGAGSSGIPPPVCDGEQFPAVSRTPSSASGNADTGTSLPSTPASSVRDSAPGSPQSVRSAWSTPLRSVQSTEAPSPSRVSASPPLSPTRNFSGALANADLSGPGTNGLTYVEEDDEDLRFAIELSIAEARSRGEDV